MSQNHPTLESLAALIKAQGERIQSLETDLEKVKTAAASDATHAINRIVELERKVAAGAGSSQGGKLPEDLIDRVANVEHLIGVKLPLKRVPGLDHLSSLPLDATKEGREQIAKKEKTEAAAKV